MSDTESLPPTRPRTAAAGEGGHDADLAGFAVSSGGDPDHGRDELERLASAITHQVRAGGPADVERVSEASPELAGRLRDIAPVIEALERWKVLKQAECGAGGLPAALPIDRLGDCRLDREIGRGGNAIVFSASQGQFWRRQVAVKVFPWRSAADGGQARQRFLDEASTLSRLQHRHIVPIYSYGSENGYSYYVMRLAEGGSLDRVVGRLRAPESSLSLVEGGRPRVAAAGFRRGDWRAIAQIGVEVAEAIAYAHANRVIHGDMKPANVLLDAAGHALVTDFGPSERSLPDDPVRLAGTYRYMAPERFDGVCDERGDVYAIGATLYECVTLTPAFEGENRESVVNSVLRHEVVPPRLHRDDLPGDLDAVIMRAMSRDPAARHPSASVLAANLRNVLQGRRIAPLSERRPVPFFRRIFGRAHE